MEQNYHNSSHRLAMGRLVYLVALPIVILSFMYIKMTPVTGLPATSDVIAAIATSQKSHQDPSWRIINNITNTDATDTNCSSPCTEAEFSKILERLTDDSNGDILKRFGEIEVQVNQGKRRRNSNRYSKSLESYDVDRIRPACLEELINLIKSLAANELEMKTVFEFATSDQVSDRISYSSSSSSIANDSSLLKPEGSDSLSLVALDNFERIRSIINGLDLALNNQTNCLNATILSNYSLNTNEQPEVVKTPTMITIQTTTTTTTTSQITSELETQSDKSRLIPKFINSVDHLIYTLERFTMTKEWNSIIKVFKGTESILEMFVNKTSKSSSKIKQGSNVRLLTNSNNNETTKPIDNSLDKIRQQLPGQVISMTSSLNSLFPWHVWPWNNLDLYSTIDTFLNHGIFAFSKTTIGPNRRIDYLPDMLRTLFDSIKYDSFPKKCSDWSKIICDKEAFHDRLTLKPLSSDENLNEEKQAIKARENKIKELVLDSKSQLTQEITCIMFSSLSMQHFGQADKDHLFKDDDRTDTITTTTATRLPWDKQVRKAIRLYELAREALTDDEWLSLYNLIMELWSKQKIPDRVIMVSRVIQLLTNCHIPKEMLESALWKDIYKYKNALNQLLDVIVEELNESSESGKFKIQQISFGSKSLQIILEKFLTLLPRLIESLSKTTIDELPDLVDRFFNEKQAFFKVPCKGYSFSDIIPSLKRYNLEIIELEDLVCKQLRIKPNITMMQINNLTNDFLAMALNFSTFGNAISSSFPKLYTSAELLSSSNQQDNQANKDGRTVKHHPADDNLRSVEGNNNDLANVTSIIDEIAANPRMSQIVAVLQSSALDPPEVHAVLPELDWVEAGTSIAMLYESIQKLMSYEQVFSIFTEIDNFQENLNDYVMRSRILFKKFSKRDPIRLVAYSLDTMMPIALRTFKPSYSFNNECLSSFRDIFSELDIEASVNNNQQQQQIGVNKQWQCFVSSLNYASWATNQLMNNFNSMFKNVLGQMTLTGSLSNKHTQNGSTKNDSCIFLDGSVSLMLDNLPQFIDLALETVLMASTATTSASDIDPSGQTQLTLYDILCSSNYVLDPFDEESIEVRAKMKEKMCHLFHKKSLENCALVLEIDKWKSTMSRLNTTWFESNVLSLNPSFREITINMHKLFELFGQLKPSTMSDSLIARLLNVNSFWSNLSNRIMNIIDKYQEKRFEYALQTLTPIIYDNIPKSSSTNNSNNHSPINLGSTNSSQTTGRSQSSLSASMAEATANQLSEIRETLTVTILGANAVLNYLDKQSVKNQPEVTVSNNTVLDELQEQIQSLFNWADQYSMITAETVLRTVANNITKLESIFKLDRRSSGSRLALDEVWHRFCSAPIETYLDVRSTIESNAEIASSSSSSSSANNSALAIEQQIKDGKDIICKFRWYEFYFKLGANSTTISKSLFQYPESQLTRIALTKWGQVLDTMLIETKHIKRLPKFFYMSYWQEFKDKIPIISPIKDQPSNLIWIWQGFEQIVNAIDSSGNNQTAISLYHVLDQLNCGLDAVKGGLSWDNIANIYQDKQDILAVHSTINNGFLLASIGVDTILTDKKFQKFLDEFIKPKLGLNSFCELRNRTKLEEIFSIPNGLEDFLDSLESFQELICDTSFETLARNINPISICYQQQQLQVSHPMTNNHPMLAETMDRFFKLASLSILDAKLIAASEAKPPLLDKDQWSLFWRRWSIIPSAEEQQDAIKRAAQSKKRVALGLYRVFQVIDSIHSDSLVWNALFKATHEMGEIVIYLERVIERRNLLGAGSSAYVNLLKEASKIKIKTKSNKNNGTSSYLAVASGSASNNSATHLDLNKPNQLTITFSNILFPEINNFISFRTFKQLRYIKIASDYFLDNRSHYNLICNNQTATTTTTTTTTLIDRNQLYGIRLIGFKLDSNDRLLSLLCNYNPTQWLRALNIAISAKSPSISKKVNLMTKYLSTFSRNAKLYPTNGTNELELDKYMHYNQLENIGTAVNLTISYLMTTTDSLKSLSFKDLTNISWHSLPNLFDSIDRHLCASKYEAGKFYIPTYEPKRMKLETIMCNMPKWNLTQVYDYFSENFDLHNMISLIATQQQEQQQVSSKQSSTSSLSASSNHNHNQNNNTTTNEQIRTCATPFKFASRWIKIGQELASDFTSKDSRSKIKKCMGLSRKEMNFYSRLLSYIKLVNSFILSMNDLQNNNSWFTVKKTWNSFSNLMLDQTSASASAAPASSRPISMLM